MVSEKRESVAVSDHEKWDSGSPSVCINRVDVGDSNGSNGSNDVVRPIS